LIFDHPFSPEELAPSLLPSLIIGFIKPAVEYLSRLSDNFRSGAQPPVLLHSLASLDTIITPHLSLGLGLLAISSSQRPTCSGIRVDHCVSEYYKIPA
jgi:hypothetical protein